MSVLGLGPAFVISGASRAGKTSLGVRLSTKLGCPLASFGDHVRSSALLLLGHAIPTRRFLQDLGQELVLNDPEAFCRAVLLSIDANRVSGPIIIDGLRHVGLLPVLARLVGDRDVRVIFVDASPDARIERWGEKITRTELNAVDSHPVEADLSQIRDKADIIINAGSGSDAAFTALMQWIMGVYPSFEETTGL
jgi:cytidylate kinase